MFSLVIKDSGTFLSFDEVCGDSPAMKYVITKSSIRKIRDKNIIKQGRPSTPEGQTMRK